VRGVTWYDVADTNGCSLRTYNTVTGYVGTFVGSGTPNCG